MGITIKDIAKIAGVSTSTVSLVISGKGYVSDTTREKVQVVIDEYNYKPSRSAQQLVSQRSGNIGFIISDIHLSRSEAFYTRILLGAELEARNYNMYILLSTVGDKIDVPAGIPRFINSQDVDGLVIAGSVPVALVKYVHKLKIPTVLIDFKVNQTNMDAVLMDNRDGAQQIVKHLVDLNLSKIGFVGGSYYHPSIKERFEGYQTAMVLHGLGAIAQNSDYHYLIEYETSPECGQRGLSKILEKVPEIEAVICVNDTTATGCLQYVGSINKKVPEEIKIVGFDNVNFSAITHPPLTTVNVPKVQMGVEALKLLMDRINNGQQVHQTRLIPVELIVRGSTIKNGSQVQQIDK
ncbi:MAG: LacI family DNA-binding transcriptional regulator [Candidatus Marinimicrobia bacterium]|nr:LacI family DNA-binding transcriptional regulator [Candidatus Neomarinimicrobiota bacterium]